MQRAGRCFVVGLHDSKTGVLAGKRKSSKERIQYNILTS